MLELLETFIGDPGLYAEPLKFLFGRVRVSSVLLKEALTFSLDRLRASSVLLLFSHFSRRFWLSVCANSVPFVDTVIRRAPVMDYWMRLKSSV